MHTARISHCRPSGFTIDLSYWWVAVPLLVPEFLTQSALTEIPGTYAIN